MTNLSSDFEFKNQVESMILTSHEYQDNPFAHSLVRVVPISLIAGTVFGILAVSQKDEKDVFDLWLAAAAILVTAAYLLFMGLASMSHHHAIRKNRKTMLVKSAQSGILTFPSQKAYSRWIDSIKLKNTLKYRIKKFFAYIFLAAFSFSTICALFFPILQNGAFFAAGAISLVLAIPALWVFCHSTHDEILRYRSVIFKAVEKAKKDA